MEGDAWDQATLDLYNSGHRKVLSGVSLRLDFSDVSGQLTTRDVDSIAFTFDEAQRSGVLWAFCHLRNANRPFRYSGIRKAVNLETGQIILDVGGYLQQQYERTPAGKMERFLTENWEPVYCLFCVAKADGYLRQKERESLKLLIQKLGMRDLELVDLLVGQIKSKWVPSQSHDYWNAVKGIANRPDVSTLAPNLLARMQQVIATDKTAHPDELKLLHYAAKAWNLPLPE